MSQAIQLFTSENLQVEVSFQGNTVYANIVEFLRRPLIRAKCLVHKSQYSNVHIKQIHNMQA